MTRFVCSSVSTLLLLAAAQAVAWQNCPSCELRDRGDRIEGVEGHEDVSGGSFELLSVHYQGASGAGGDRVHLYFWVPQAGELDEIRVWQPGRRYKMEPREKNYAAGPGRFSWRKAEVLGPLQLPVSSLYVRIKRGKTYLPAQVTTGQPATRRGYAFVFRSGAGVDATCSISKSGGAQPVRSFECFLDYSGDLIFEWNGLDDNGQSVPDGKYVLKIEGYMLTATPRPMDEKVVFQHRARLQ